MEKQGLAATTTPTAILHEARCFLSQRRFAMLGHPIVEWGRGGSSQKGDVLFCAVLFCFVVVKIGEILMREVLEMDGLKQG